MWEREQVKKSALQVNDGQRFGIYLKQQFSSAKETIFI